ncbi:alpha/beta hydrolase [Streptomyces luteireticuli]|uniref:alpha/beta hydrolase n=1 Tax=Streptomyces luteireticuli TaxID=173858 RepID=UPI00355634E4
MSSLFQRLFNLNTAPLESAASSWRTLGDKLASAHTFHRQQVTGPLESGWEGEAAKAGKEVLGILQGQMEAAHVDALLIAKVLETVRIRMTQAQTDLRNAVRSAEQEHYVVDDGTGQVKMPTWLLDAQHDPDQPALFAKYAVGMQKYQDSINQALKDAEQASEEGRKAITEFDPQGLHKEDALGQSAKAAKGIAKDLGVGPFGWPRGHDVKENAAWWKGLDQDQQQLFIAMYPEKVGAMNGLPSAVRDSANRLLLDQMLNPARPDHAINPDEFNKQQAGLQALKSKLDSADGVPAEQRLYLLKVDPRGDGRAIIAMGNPDTAANTAVLVPGTNTNLESIPGQVDRISGLQRVAMKLRPNDSTAVISWLDYEAPQVKVSDSRVDLGVAGTSRAEDGGEALREFTAGTRAAQGERHGRLTVIGHSYGSTTMGAGAAGGRGLEADNIIALGSPGLTVEHARDLHVDPRHVYIGTADDDGIKRAADKTLGIDPATSTFGAQRIRVDTSGHSGYWDWADSKTPSESLVNQGRIITGSQAPTTTGYEPAPFGRPGYDMPFPHVPQGVK